jgi:hypothetical protein
MGWIARTIARIAISVVIRDECECSASSAGEVNGSAIGGVIESSGALSTQDGWQNKKEGEE